MHQDPLSVKQTTKTGEQGLAPQQHVQHLAAAAASSARHVELLEALVHQLEDATQRLRASQ